MARQKVADESRSDKACDPVPMPLRPSDGVRDENGDCNRQRGQYERCPEPEKDLEKKTRGLHLASARDTKMYPLPRTALIWLAPWREASFLRILLTCTSMTRSK